MFFLFVSEPSDDKILDNIFQLYFERVVVRFI